MSLKQPPHSMGLAVCYSRLGNLAEGPMHEWHRHPAKHAAKRLCRLMGLGMQGPTGHWGHQ